MALNLDMVNDTIGGVLEDESTGAGVEVPHATWEQLLTWGVDPRTLREVRGQLRDLSNDSKFEALTHDLFEKYMKYMKKEILVIAKYFKMKVLELV
jgi:hypothetical protein